MPRAAKSKARDVSKTGSSDPPPGLSREQIARRAYEIHLLRGGAHGHDIDDWLQAGKLVIPVSVAPMTHRTYS
jgi:hypothetical protein